MNHTEQPPARLRRAVLEAYLQGYDDARAECAADIEENGVLTRRVQELEALHDENLNLLAQHMTQHDTHVALPLDASAVSDAVVVRARDAFSSHIESTTLVGAVLENADVDLAMRAAIAALAQALAEEGTRDA
jgi:hypothetical protein